MTLPLVMPSNLVGMALRLEKEHPGRLGLLFSPDGWRPPREGISYALDNGRFPCWSAGKAWNEELFLSMLDRADKAHPPRWVAVPDVVADAESTFKEWSRWAPELARRGWPLALVVQDGMTPADARTISPSPDVIFVGGTTGWKWRHLSDWCRNFPRVHVGRVNTGRLLWRAHRQGAESSDGTGWWHKKQQRQLVRYLERSGAGKGEHDHSGFFY